MVEKKAVPSLVDRKNALHKKHQHASTMFTCMKRQHAIYLVLQTFIEQTDDALHQMRYRFKMVQDPSMNIYAFEP